MRDVFVEIWQTARRNKLRTTLTGFAVAWGIFMLIVLLGAGNGLINANLKQNENWLSNSMEVWGGMTSKAYQGLKEGRRIRLQTSDLAMTESDFPETVDEVGAHLVDADVAYAVGDLKRLYVSAPGRGGLSSGSVHRHLPSFPKLRSLSRVRRPSSSGAGRRLL